MFDSIVRAVLVRKQMVIGATAFAVLTAFLSAAAMPNAIAQLETINVDISDGDISVDVDDIYVRISDGQISVSIGELLNDLGGGFLP